MRAWPTSGPAGKPMRRPVRSNASYGHSARGVLSFTLGGAGIGDGLAFFDGSQVTQLIIWGGAAVPAGSWVLGLRLA